MPRMQGCGPAGAAQAPRGGYLAARAVGAFLPKLTRKAFEKYGFSAAALLTDWPAIVGEEIAAMAFPERLKWPRSVEARADVEPGAEGRPGAILVVRVDPARALDVEYRGRQIVERINGHFGYRAVAELRLVQAPLARRAKAPAVPAEPTPPPCPAPELASIPDERLRAALAKLKSGLAGRAQSPR